MVSYFLPCSVKMYCIFLLLYTIRLLNILLIARFACTENLEQEEVTEII